MIRVLSVYPVAEIGGAETVLLNLMRYRRRPDITHEAVILADKDGELGEAFTRLGIRWQSVRRGRMRQPQALWSACREVRRIVRESHATVVLANSPQGFLYARWATIGLGVPIALYYMAVPRRRLWRSGALNVLMAKSSPSAVFTASHAINTIVSTWGLNNVKTVYHGAPVPSADASGRRDVESQLLLLGIRREDPLILAPGRLQPWKGQQVLIAALPEVLKTHAKAQAVVLGGTLFGHTLEYSGQLRRQIHALSLTQRVHLVGHQPVAPWLERANVVVHTSTEPDPFPNVCIEALASSRPLITNHLSGTAEVIKDGLQGRVIPANDPAALASAITALLNDPVGAERMAEAGYRRYVEVCMPDRMVHSIETTLATMSLSAASDGSTNLPASAPPRDAAPFV